MGDLTGKKRSEPTRLVGADPATGEETNFAGIDSFQNLQAVDTPVTAGSHLNISVTTTAQELRCGGTVLNGRKFVSIQPKGRRVYYGYDNTVTSSTGTEVFKNQTLYIPIGPFQKLWLISDQASGVPVRITES